MNIYQKAAEAIQNADALVITSGAGMGVDSGLPDFRGNTGFWKEYPAISHLGISFAEMANPRWFDERPQLAWAFYGHRYNLYNKTLPHQGFSILLEYAKKKQFGYFVFTSNVDGQFQKAAYDDAFIEEVHGSINHMQCSVPCCSDIWDAGDLHIEINAELFEAQEPFPRCPKCGAIARPNILMFGDWSWLSHRSNEQGYNFDRWLRNLIQNAARPVIIEMGAGRAVPTVRMKSQRIAQEFSTELIRINPRDFQTSGSVKGIEIAEGSLKGVQKIFEFID
jgi:NAD-dependent SIR2 family protein deacetylase